jgi:hypothetical protein
MWPVNRRCLLLGTWSYLRYIRGSVLTGHCLVSKSFHLGHYTPILTLCSSVLSKRCLEFFINNILVGHPTPCWNTNKQTENVASNRQEVTSVLREQTIGLKNRGEMTDCKIIKIWSICIPCSCWTRFFTFGIESDTHAQKFLSRTAKV